MKVETRKVLAEIRTEGGKIRGFVPFNSLSSDLGGFVEKIMPGAMAESIRTQTVNSFWSHNTDKPLGNTKNGKLKLTETRDGLQIVIDPPATTWGRDAVESIRRGDTEGFSFGFTVAPDGENLTEDNEGRSIRELTKINLKEVSPVVFPAYPKTTAAVRHKGYKNMNTKEKREERARLLREMRTLNDNGLDTAEKRQQYDRMDSDFEQLTRDIQLEEREDYMRSSQGTITGRPDPNANMDIRQRVGLANRDDITVWTPGTYKAPNWSDSEIRSLSAKLGYQTRDALQVDDQTKGGYSVQSEQLSKMIIAKKMDVTFVRQYATVIELPNAVSLGVPALSAEPEDASFTAEIREINEDSATKFEGRQLYPHPLSKSLPVSKVLVRKNPRIAEFIKDRLGYKLGVAEEKAFVSTSGTGVNQPLSIMVDSANGISSNRDMSTGNTATAITADGLINCKYNLRSQYRNSPNCRWAFHRDAVKMIRKLKDGDGQYLWTMGLTGKPDTILDIPFSESEYLPNTFTASQYVGILGDFSYYWIVDSLAADIQVAREILIKTNQDLFVIRSEVDGMPVLEDAFSRVQLAA